MEVYATRPDSTFRSAFFRMLDDYATHDPANGREYALPAREGFDEYVQSLLDAESSEGLSAGYVPCSHRWLVTGTGDIVGIVRIRHRIDSSVFADVVGHIGYDVPPSKRGRGFGVLSLQAGLKVAAELGLEDVLLLADAENAASWRTIERCGGVLERQSFSSHHACQVRRYWIHLP